MYNLFSESLLVTVFQKSKIFEKYLFHSEYICESITIIKDENDQEMFFLILSREIRTMHVLLRIRKPFFHLYFFVHLLASKLLHVLNDTLNVSSLVWIDIH